MAEGYVTLDGNGDYLETADKAGLDITGDMEIITLAAATTWAAPLNQYFFNKEGATTERAYRYMVKDDGTLQVAWSADGTNRVWLTSDTPVDAEGASHLWTRCRFDVNVGGTDATATFDTSFDPRAADPLAVGWTQLGAVVHFGATTSIFASTASLYLGGHPLHATQKNWFGGVLFGVWIFNGIGGTEVVNADFRDDDQGWSTPPGTDDHGNDWAFNGNTFWTPPTAEKITGRSVHYDFENNRVLIESGV